VLTLTRGQVIVVSIIAAACIASIIFITLLGCCTYRFYRWWKQRTFETVGAETADEAQDSDVPPSYDARMAFSQEGL
jgi:hypothetical protein